MRLQVREIAQFRCPTCDLTRDIIIRTYSFNYSICCKGIIKIRRQYPLFHYFLSMSQFIKEMFYQLTRKIYAI